MGKNLVVNGKEYYPSAEIAQTFGYTSDYVSRIAREEKIIATRIGRQWFVDKDSFEEFVVLVKQGKQDRSEALKKERQAERMMQEQKVADAHKSSVLYPAVSRVTSPIAGHAVALAQSVAVVACGIFAGLLGWTVSGADLEIQDFAFAIDEMSEQVTQRVVPTDSPLVVLSDFSSLVATVVWSVRDEAVPVRVAGSAALTESVQESGTTLEFSDEVDVVFREGKDGTVRPVFKNSTDGQEYEIVVDPVINSTQ